MTTTALKRLGAAALALTALLVAGCGSAPDASSTTGVINAIGAENEYANVLGQIGGQYVRVSSILNNPNTDPHTYEASPSVAEEVSAAQLIVQNGVGYDGFMGSIEFGLAKLEPQGDRRPACPWVAGQHSEPAPLVRTHHDAEGRCSNCS